MFGLAQHSCWQVYPVIASQSTSWHGQHPINSAQQVTDLNIVFNTLSELTFCTGSFGYVWANSDCISVYFPAWATPNAKVQ